MEKFVFIDFISLCSSAKDIQWIHMENAWLKYERMDENQSMSLEQAQVLRMHDNILLKKVNCFAFDVPCTTCLNPFPSSITRYCSLKASY